jgi:hypothetical protein
MAIRNVGEHSLKRKVSYVSGDSTMRTLDPTLRLSFGPRRSGLASLKAWTCHIIWRNQFNASLACTDHAITANTIIVIELPKTVGTTDCTKFVKSRMFTSSY